MSRWRIALPLAAVALGCGSPSSHPTFPTAPVILISVDTLRSDRLPAYGYRGVETPAIDRLARDGMVFERAFSHYPITLASHASILTGLLPSQHGVRDNVGFRLDSPALPFLPRLLGDHGYATGGAVSVFLLRRDTGIGEDFDFFEDSIGLKSAASLGESQRSGHETLAAARSWLQSAAADPRPFFFFFHLYEPHTPWDPPPPFAGRYPHPYDGEVAAADAVVGALFDELDRLAVYDRAIVLLLSDHGEGLGDHGEQEHGILLYREALQVPLILKLPAQRRAGTRVQALAGLIDVYPTVARLCGLDAGEGISLLDLAAATPPQRQLYAETYYPRFHLGMSELHSLIDGDLHLIEGPRPELFDLASDPTEGDDILSSHRGDYHRMRQRIESLQSEPQAPQAVDPEAAERLAALGYLTAPSRDSSGPLPDPRQNLALLDDLYAAFRAQHQQDYAAAVAGFRRVLAANPEMVDAWENLAQSLRRLGRFDEAVAAFRRALELSGGADYIALGAARLFLETDQLAEARRHAELAVATNPSAAHRVLARIALAEGDRRAAEDHARSALAARPSAVEPWIVLAQIAIEAGDLGPARQHLEKAEEAQARRHGEDPAPGLQLTRGDLAARSGQAAIAEAAFRREIALYPEDPRAYSRLALLCFLEQRHAEAVAILRQLVESNETPPAYAAAVETLQVIGERRGAAELLWHARERFPDNPRLKAMLRQVAAGSG